MRQFARLCVLLAHLRQAFCLRVPILGLHPEHIMVTNPIQTTRRSRSFVNRSTRHGLTLVEMMVSVVLTLMVVFALVRVFELLGSNVTDGRATMELSSSMRQTVGLLRDDLAGLTTTVRPWRDPEQSDGYFEVIDGPSTDSQHYVRSASDGTTQFIRTSAGLDTNQDLFLDTMSVPYDTSVGDIDDVLAFTSRNATNQFKGTISHPGIGIPIRDPASGKYIPQPVVSALAPTRLIDSPEAEIIWWVQVQRNLQVDDIQQIAALGETEQLVNAVGSVASVQRYPNSTGTTLGTPIRSLHRRVLLIRPDLDLRAVKLPTVESVATFISNNDISVSVSYSDSEKAFKVKANSLGDLSIRHNRACRSSFSLKQASLKSFPQTTQLKHAYDSDDGAGEMMGQNSLLIQQAAMKDMVIHSDIYGSGVFMIRRGRDVVLSDVLGFDLQVWDPQALVKMAADGTAVTPSDPGYFANSNMPILASGAYVDLGYGTVPKAPVAIPSGMFGGIANVKSGLLNNQGWGTYCTWCAEYEHDGLNQSTNKLIKAHYQDVGISHLFPPADEGENGFDDDGVNGVDDPGERETSPPYPHPLRGLKVKIRAMEFNTRQVRQSSVVTDFLPE